MARFFSTVNKLAVPFLSDDGAAEDDYALLPPPRPLGVLQLMGITFFAVSGSAYGIEEAVSAGGPLLSIVALISAALLWSAPLAMVSAELSVALPHSGGYIVWVNTAFGPMASLLNGMANLLCNVFDCALYPLLLTEYVERALLPLLPPEPHGGGGSEWMRLAPDLIGTALRLLLVAIAAVVNILGINVVGVGAGVMMVLVSLPVLALTITAYASPYSHPLEPFDPAVQQLPSSHAQWYFFAALVLWNSCGYDSAGMVAAEVVDGRTTLPRALSGALVLTTLSYLLPIAACASAVDPTAWPTWGEGHFELLGQKLGGRALGSCLLLGTVVSMVGVMCTLVCTTSRAICAMAQLRMLPAPIARLHPATGTPWLAVMLNASLISLATVMLHFEALVELSMFFYAINVIAQCGALVRLRSTHPHRLRPQRTLPSALLALPLTISGLILAASPVRNWIGAAVLLGALLLTYALIHLARLMQGHKPTDPPSARATAAAEALQVAVPRYGGDSAEDAAAIAELRRAPDECAARGPGDAWFNRLIQSYRSVPNREHAAIEMVQAFEMGPLEAAEWETPTDAGLQDYESDEDRQPSEQPPAPAETANNSASHSAELPRAAAPSAKATSGEVSASEAAHALAAEREGLSAAGGGDAQGSMGDEGFIDIIE